MIKIFFVIPFSDKLKQEVDIGPKTAYNICPIYIWDNCDKWWTDEKWFQSTINLLNGSIKTILHTSKIERRNGIVACPLLMICNDISWHDPQATSPKFIHLLLLSVLTCRIQVQRSFKLKVQIVILWVNSNILLLIFFLNFLHDFFFSMNYQNYNIIIT